MKAIKKFKYLLKLMHHVSPSFIFIVIFGSIFQSLQVFGNVIIPKFLIDELIGDQNIRMIIIWASIIVLNNLILGFINKTYQRILGVKNEYVSLKVMEAMSEKIMNIEYKYLEDPYYLDLKERAIFAVNNQSALVRVVRDISGIVTSIITLFGLIAIMLTLGYQLILILFVGIFISLLINFLFMKLQLKFFQSIIPINRKYNYYFGLTMNETITKDMRLYNMSPLINNRIKVYNEELEESFYKFALKAGTVNGFTKVITAIQTGLVYLFISSKAIGNFLNRISIGDFTMYANSAISFTVTFDKLFDEVINMFQVLSYLDPFVEFMQLPNVRLANKDLKLEKVETIEFRNVSFTYPKSETIILNDISFKINRGEKIAIVGLNGAGKTTVIKLLCRFYPPESGEILINGINIIEYDYESYLHQMAVVFQDYRLFAYSIKENITNADIEDNEILEVIKQVGLDEKISELPMGINSRLNKAYDEEGVELSGGQGQKIAIARALYKDASLVILDEPTSALDPIAEAEIYQKFNDLVQDKTAIYISHRMSSSVFCDYVLVIENGKIVSFDTHKNLMKETNSLYYKLFTTQAENYQLD